MQSSLPRMFGWVRWRPHVIILVLMYCTHLPAQESISYPIVRLDLNAGGFLNPLPFDRPFLIQGQASQDMTQINVTFEEFLDAGHLFAERPGRLAAFEREVRALLDSVRTNPSGRGVGRQHTIERRLSNLLRQHAGSTGGVSIGDAMNILPWNWGNWAMMIRAKLPRLLTAGTLFDPSEEGNSPRVRFRALVEDGTIEQQVSFVLHDARDVRIAHAPSPLPSVIKVTWHKLRSRRSKHREPLPVDSSSRWNRLEQRLHGDPVTETEVFRLMVQPLEANRTYLIRVQAEHSSSADSVQTPPRQRIFGPIPGAANT